MLLYIAAQIGIGAWLYQRIKTDNDYFLAGKRLGLLLCSVSVFATWFGAETCIGSSGAVYAEGLSGSRVDPFGYTICLLGMGLFFAARLYLTGATTLADYHRARFGPVVERLSA